MNTLEFLYSDMKVFHEKTNHIQLESNTLIQIFTATLKKEDALNLAKQIQGDYPKVEIIGVSVGTIIFEGKQYEEGTMIVIEKFENTKVHTHFFDIEGLDVSQVIEEVKQHGCNKDTKMMRMFFGNYYADAHQFVEEFNNSFKDTIMVGGIAGEGGNGDLHPYVFNAQKACENAGIFCALSGERLSVFSRVNISHEAISETSTITKCDGNDFFEIDGEPAVQWFQNKLGYLSTDIYTSWKEIADYDPLVRFQIILDGHHGASRFIKYKQEKDTLGQYFTRVDEGTKFQLSYTSPAKCVEETRQICEEIQNTKVEHLFTYSCILRKMFLQNCSSWEIMPFKNSKLSGVFLLGEFGAIENQYNELLNGSCVYSGIAEKESYIDVDMSAFENLNKVKNQNKELLEFVLRKRQNTKTRVEDRILDHVVLHEHAKQDYLYKDTNFNMENILKYEAEKDLLRINKLCLIKIENAQDIIGHYGQNVYFEQMKFLIVGLKERNILSSIGNQSLYDYTISFDSFIVAASNNIDSETFISKMKSLNSIIKKQQNQKNTAPIITRFICVEHTDNLLENAYAELQKFRDTQKDFIIAAPQEHTNAELLNEFAVLKDINYALAEHKVIPYYQGIRNNNSNKIDKYEALIRIQTKEGKILSPFIFMDISKKHRMYLPLTRMMIDSVLRQFNDIDCQVSINVSYLDIHSESFRHFLRNRLKTFKKPERLIFEILEDECFKEVDDLKSFIEEMRSLKVSIAIDDFGAGYSNLLEIIRIKPNFIKIDGQIIREIHCNHDNQIVLELITTLAKDLNVQLVAEFVENEEIQQEVLKYGIAFSQGYVFSKLMPFSELKFED